MADPAQLEAVILREGKVIHNARYRLITSLTAYDDSGAWALSGARTCAHWAAERLGMNVGTVREWLRIGRALKLLPIVNEAMKDGELSYCAVRSLTRIAVDHRDHESELTALAKETRTSELSRELARWALGHDTDEQREERERRETYLSARIDPDGMGTIHMRLPATDLGRVQAAIDAVVLTARAEQHDRDPSGLHRSLGYRRARALVCMLSGAQGPDAVNSATQVGTEVILHVRADGCSMHDGTPIADSKVASMVDASFMRAMIHDAQDRPVNVSARRRHPTSRQKLIVHERDQVCVDCGGRELLEYDHVPDYSISGRTHTDELQLRCSGCHRKRHASPAETAQT